ncbi:hypothetical protein STIAU_2197, partial [Stigmatella aurantiaca DW4/3-1]
PRTAASTHASPFSSTKPSSFPPSRRRWNTSAAGRPPPPLAIFASHWLMRSASR